VHVFGDVINSMYRDIYFMNVVMLVTVSVQLHTACMF